MIFASFHQGKEEHTGCVFMILPHLLRSIQQFRNFIPLPKKFPLPIPLLYVILFPREELPTGNHPQISSGASPDRPEFEIRNCIAAHTGVFYENSRVIEKQEALFHPPSRRGRGNDGSRSRSNRFPQMLHGRKEGQPRGLPLREEAEGR